MQELSLDETFVSVSGKKGDVIVDLRTNSSTYKEWIGIELSEENHRALHITRGLHTDLQL
ncbi:MAG: dTDP-4-keto-6-deoxy-D-glucose epimerase [Lachnospiraceae bacterium]|nr:dTDP-4-keto-6-deoxy-D-glucose epimerase [Lachnospiraceae bacterium]